MRVIEVQEYGDADVLREVDRPEPQAGPGQVLVRVRATTVNPVDWLTRAGVLAAMAPHLRPPLVLGWDLAGAVVDGGGGFAAGQRVAGMVPWFAAGAGTYAEAVAVDAGWLAPVPDGLDDVTAATLPLNGLTARQAFDLLGAGPGAPQPGGTVLVSGASGAVGGYVVQLAVAAGLHVVAVASAGDEAHVSGLGAKDVLTRAEPAALVAAARAVAPDGVDAALDAGTVGPPMVDAVRDGGAFVSVLDFASPTAERGVRVAKVSVQPDADQLGELLAALAAGRLTSRVAGTLPLGQAAEAHRRAEAGGVRGKLVLTACPPLLDLLTDVPARAAAYRSRMSSLSHPGLRLPPSSATWDRRFYWAATGMFCTIFVVSVALTVVDPQTTRVQLRQLGFPVYLMYPQAIAKLLGVVAILSRRSRTLTNLAFAGFLYDLLLALAAHIAERETYGLVAAFGLVVWGAAFWADRRRFPPAPGY